MIRIFYGDDRILARKMIDKQLGADYEVMEAETLQASDVASVFLGTSLFGETRNILLKDLSANKECWAMLPKVADDCTHNIVLWESKLDKRSAAYKSLSKNKNIEFKEFKLAEDPNKKLVFDVFEAAFSGDSKKALMLCGKIESDNDPYMLLGLMVTQAVKKLQFNNSRAPKVLKILAQADIDMKSTGIESWKIIKMALLKIGECK